MEDLLKQILENMATKADIARIEQRLDRIEKKLDATFEQTAKITEAQVRHERILEVLSLRSIDQESSINSFLRDK